MYTNPELPQNSPTDEQLSPKQQAAVALLAAGKSYTDVAAALEVDRKTVWSWRQDRGFAGALAHELELLRDTLHGRVIALADRALGALERVLEHADSDAARIAAAKLVLDRLLPAYDSPADARGSSPPATPPAPRDDGVSREEKIAILRALAQTERPR